MKNYHRINQYIVDDINYSGIEFDSLFCDNFTKYKKQFEDIYLEIFKEVYKVIDDKLGGNLKLDEVDDPVFVIEKDGPIMNYRIKIEDEERELTHNVLGTFRTKNVVTLYTKTIHKQTEEIECELGVTYEEALRATIYDVTAHESFHYIHYLLNERCGVNVWCGKNDEHIDNFSNLSYRQIKEAVKESLARYFDLYMCSIGNKYIKETQYFIDKMKKNRSDFPYYPYDGAYYIDDLESFFNILETSCKEGFVKAFKLIEIGQFNSDFNASRY